MEELKIRLENIRYYIVKNLNEMETLKKMGFSWEHSSFYTDASNSVNFWRKKEKQILKEINEERTNNTNK